MAYTTDSALLVKVNDAIDAAITGRIADYQIGARQARYIPLKALREMRAELEHRIAQTTSGGGIALTTFRRT